MRNLTKEWLKAAYDDLITIEEIKDNVLLTHIVAFHAQQCVEKVFKAILEENQIEIPKIHKLRQLLTLFPEKIIEPEEKILSLLDKLYIESRYPGDFGLLPDGKPTIEDAREFYVFAKNIYDKILHLFEAK